MTQNSGALLALLETAGIQLSADGPELVLRGRTRELTAELRAEIIARKPELLHELRPPEAESEPAHAVAKPCEWCGSLELWQETVNPTGPRCARCHPPDHLTPAEVTRITLPAGTKVDLLDVGRWYRDLCAKPRREPAPGAHPARTHAHLCGFG